MHAPTPSAAQARIADLVRAYRVAEYRWELDGEWLHLRIGQAAPALARQFPGARWFGLISAWDPYSIPRPEPVNRRADEQLQQDLAASGLAHRPAFSSAANRSWREPSWVVADMPPDRFDTLSRRHGQLAALAWPAEAAVRLRVDAARPFEVAPDDAIDWLHA